MRGQCSERFWALSMGAPVTERRRVLCWKSSRCCPGNQTICLACEYRDCVRRAGRRGLDPLRVRSSSQMSLLFSCRWLTAANLPSGESARSVSSAGWPTTSIVLPSRSNQVSCAARRTEMRAPRWRRPRTTPALGGKQSPETGIRLVRRREIVALHGSRPEDEVRSVGSSARGGREAGSVPHGAIQ
jgi:hypothetical protein